MRHARLTARLTAEAQQDAEDPELTLAELFQEDVPVEEELVALFPVVCSLQRLES